MSAKVSTVAKAAARYGVIENGKWPGAEKWCTIITPPAELIWLCPLAAEPFKPSHIYCNRDMAPALERALRNVVTRGLVGELLTYDGCWEIRAVRGKPDDLSTHSYALAIDINAKMNLLGQKPTISAALVACFTDEGFDWGGNFHRVDGMHFSFGWEGKPLGGLAA